MQAGTVTRGTVDFKVRSKPVLDFTRLVVDSNKTRKFPRCVICKGVFEYAEIAQSHELPCLNLALGINNKAIELFIVESEYISRSFVMTSLAIGPSRVRPSDGALHTMVIVNIEY